MRAKLLSVGLGCGAAVMLACCNISLYSDFEYQPLEFPFEDAGDIVSIAAFGIPNWSDTEPHNGIDLIIDEHATSARLISPTAGVLTNIFTNENPFSDPPGQLLLTIAIRINSEWTVSFVLEPGTVDAATKAEQLEAILVSVGEEVEVGMPVANLLVGELGHPHLHYMVQHDGEPVCAYAHSSNAARAVFENLSELPDSSLPDGNICYGQN